MSKNFELLRQTDWSQEFFQGLPTETRHIETAQKCIKRRPMGNDQISTLVQRVFLDPRSSHIRCVMFTANSRRVGCTWVCAHAAKMLAESIEGTVCAVDTNFREPALHSYFSVEGRDGLANAVAESRPAKEFAKQTQEANLWLVAAGRSTGRSGSTARYRHTKTSRRLILWICSRIIMNTRLGLWSNSAANWKSFSSSRAGPRY